MKTAANINASPEVEAFVEKHGLADALEIAVEVLAAEFPGCPITAEHEVLEDCGREIVVVEVTAPGEPQTLHRRLDVCGREVSRRIGFPASTRLLTAYKVLRP